ncbi:restriction endonuclease subunit S [Virgibacillus byunsanensis]|uniref:Restriction endonuclease subunit S n=1 Tax=Virgibacillus byunsanensis TaxID=570945 RepID=A0ABW3LJW9_9BACI
MECSERNTAKLKEMTLKIGSGSTPRGGKKSYLSSGEISLIRSQNIYNHHFEQNGLAYISEGQAAKLKNVTVQENDILINITGDSIARNMIISSEFLPARVNQHVSIIRCDDEKLDPFYLSAVLTSRRMQDYLISLGQIGGTRAALTKKMLEELEVPVINIDQQRLIGKLLSKLNTKINTNNEIISNLEQLAQTLFNHWFFDFEFPNENGEPYQSSGGKMVESELGMMPDGWSVDSLSYYMHETISGEWGKEAPQKNHQYMVNVIRGADIPELRLGKDGKAPKRYILEKNFDKKSLSVGDVLIEVSGGSPTQSTGRTLLVDEILLEKYDNKAVSTNFCRVLRPLKSYFGTFIHLLLLQMYQKDLFFQLENGTTGIKNLDVSNLVEKHKVILPSNDVVKEFSDLANDLLTMIQQKGDENRKIKKLRDTLLPKLLSGELELPMDSEVTDDVSIS